MGEFDQIVGVEGHLLRGVNGIVERELFDRIGLGPLYLTARRAYQEKIELSAGALKLLADRLQKYGKVESLDFLNKPRASFENTFDAVQAVANNHLTVNDHVFSEESVLTRPAARGVESLTSDPRIAVCYAYGIHPDRLTAIKPNDGAAFYLGCPNEQAAVAVIDASEASILDGAHLNRVAVEGTGEVKRRMHRDTESLIQNLVRVMSFVPLDPFNMTAPIASLDDAAKKLIGAGVAKIP